MIFNMTGGGVSMACEIVGGLSAPTNPKANTIWVKTDIPILKTIIQPTVPTGAGNAAAGAVYIQDNASTWVTPNFAITNSPKVHMRCFPGSTYQHNGSKWVKKDAYIQQSGKWMQISSEFSAKISVACPTGSTVTCSNGGTTFTATNVNGECIFTVRKSGTWVVKAALDGKSASTSVQITSDEQKETVSLSYETFLYKVGDQCTDVTGGWDGTKAGSGYLLSGTHRFDSDGLVITLDDYSSWGVYTKNKLDVSDYSKLVVEYEGANICNDGNTIRVFHAELLDDLTVGDWNFQNRAAYKNTTDGTKTSLTVDISKITGKKHIAVEYGTNLHKDEAGVKITKVYLA